MQKHERELAVILAAIMMPSASGSIDRALSMAGLMLVEAKRRWPDDPDQDFDQKVAWIKEEVEASGKTA